MDKVLKLTQNIAMGVALGVLLLGVALLLNGCTFARGPAGEIIVGVPLGTLVETSEQALIGAAGMIPGIGPFLQNLLMGAAAGGMTVAGAAKAGRIALEKRRKNSDVGREDLRVELAEVKATLAERMKVDA